VGLVAFIRTAASDCYIIYRKRFGSGSFLDGRHQVLQGLLEKKGASTSSR
jgi:hypothetical protein